MPNVQVRMLAKQSKIVSTCVSCDIRHRFFTERVVPIWNSLPPEVFEATSLNSFKAKLDSVL